MGAFMSLVMVAFGIGWTILAFTITQGAPFPMVHFIFPLFGVIFVIVGIVQFFYALSNATRQNRYSVMDVTTDREEPDPLNQVFGKPAGKTTEAVETRLKELDGLRAKGVISASEHAAQRERILREI